jgi:hypothetical protein
VVELSLLGSENRLRRKLDVEGTGCGVNQVKSALGVELEPRLGLLEGTVCGENSLSREQ